MRSKPTRLLIVTVLTLATAAGAAAFAQTHIATPSQSAPRMQKNGMGMMGGANPMGSSGMTSGGGMMGGASGGGMIGMMNMMSAMTRMANTCNRMMQSMGGAESHSGQPNAGHRQR